MESRLRTHLVHPERASAPVVLVLHGYGAPGDDLLPVAEWLGARTQLRYVVAEAPLALPYGGRAWWHIDMAAREAQLRRGEGLDLRAERPLGVDAARAQIDALIADTMRKYGVSAEQIALLGFSQGAMLAMETTLHRELGPRCLVMLSGTFLSEAVWAPRFAAHRQVPVFMSHGRGDGVLPYARSEQLKERLESEGYSVRFRPFEGGHEIPRPVLDDVVSFLDACFSKP